MKEALKIVPELLQDLRAVTKQLEEEKQKVRELSEKVKAIDASQQYLFSRTEELHWRAVEAESRNMRKNILIRGPGLQQAAPDRPNERWEEAEKAVKELLEKMGVEGAEIERAHRIGGFREGRQRAIVVRMARFPQKEAIMRKKGAARASGYWLSDQYPQEILDKRHRLREAAEKRFGKLGDGSMGTVKVIHVYDKIRVDGCLYELRTGPEGDTLLAVGRPGGRSHYGAAPARGGTGYSARSSSGKRGAGDAGLGAEGDEPGKRAHTEGTGPSSCGTPPVAPEVTIVN
jgi:hypothetical protein